MTGEDDILALKELVETKMKALQVLIETKLNSIERATIIANTNLEKRLEGMNEFRQQLKDQASSFITRTDHENLTNKVDSSLKEIKAVIQVGISRPEYESQISKLESDIKDLQLAKANLEGKASQSSVIIAYIISGISLLLGAIGMILSLAKAFGGP